MLSYISELKSLVSSHDEIKLTPEDQVKQSVSLHLKWKVLKVVAGTGIACIANLALAGLGLFLELTKDERIEDCMNQQPSTLSNCQEIVNGDSYLPFFLAGTGLLTTGVITVYAAYDIRRDARLEDPQTVEYIKYLLKTCDNPGDFYKQYNAELLIKVGILPPDGAVTLEDGRVLKIQELCNRHYKLSRSTEQYNYTRTHTLQPRPEALELDADWKAFQSVIGDKIVVPKQRL